MPHHLIFEGAELAGKSYLMSRIYGFLEKKYNQSGFILDGCHWFNADNGIFGGRYSRPALEGYLRIFSALADTNVIVEKFHISDIVYQKIYRNRIVDYSGIEDKLGELGFKAVLVVFKEDAGLIKKRIEDRLKLYPHYKRILKSPEWYMDQQRLYKKELFSSSLPHIVIETGDFSGNTHEAAILDWLEEN